MATKKYKSVSGYLRSADEEMRYKIPRDVSNDERRSRTKTNQRNIINHLLPQLGLPKLNDDATPLEGVERLLAIGGTEQQVKALKDCQRWLKNYRIITAVSSGVRAQVKTEQGLVSYHVRGFKCDDHSSIVNVIVDADPDADIRPHAIAEALAGPDYCFVTSSNILMLVPDVVKNRLLTDEELYSAVPELNPYRSRSTAKRRG